MRPYREHPAARDEYLESVAWYEAREPGLGSQFSEELNNAVDYIRHWPDAAPLFLDRDYPLNLRVMSLPVFPFGIVYFERGNEIIIVAYQHERRRPGYWATRLQAI